MNRVKLILMGEAYNMSENLIKTDWPKILESKALQDLIDVMWQNGSIKLVGASLETEEVYPDLEFTKPRLLLRLRCMILRHKWIIGTDVAQGTTFVAGVCRRCRVVKVWSSDD